MENQTPAAEATITDSPTESSPPTSTSSNSAFGLDWASQLDSIIGSELEKDANPDSAEKPVIKEPAKEENPVKEEKQEVSPDKEESDETPKGLTGKAAIKWKELRAEASEATKLREQLAAREQEIESLKTTPSGPELEQLRQSAEELRKLNGEYEAELAVARVEATQEFKSNVVEPMKSVATFLMELSKKYDIKDSEIFNVVSDTDVNQSDKIADIASSMNERDRLRFYRAADDYAAIMDRRSQFQANAKERAAEILQRQEAETARAAQDNQAARDAYNAQYSEATKTVMEQMRKSIPVMADAEVATDVEKLGSADYSDATVDLKAYLANAGAVLPHMLKAYKSLQSQLEESQKTLASYRNSSAPAGGGKTADNESAFEGMGFLEALEAKMG